MSTKYDASFKQEAINIALSSEQTYRQTANDLVLNTKLYVIGYNKP